MCLFAHVGVWMSAHAGECLYAHAEVCPFPHVAGYPFAHAGMRLVAQVEMMILIAAAETLAETSGVVVAGHFGQNSGNRFACLAET
mmetsp:Transcript_26253/g.34500  ORF Transcript_26253/g.34500 Transcript_26253/m.34500 type:complete len:86 (-) Transcript_26253:440-697(-)